MNLDWTAQGLQLTGVLAALQVLVLLAALVVVPRGRRPSSALAWILLVLLVPLLGVLLFAVIGSPKLPRRRRAKQRSMNARIGERARNAAAAAGQALAARPGGSHVLGRRTAGGRASDPSRPGGTGTPGSGPRPAAAAVAPGATSPGPAALGPAALSAAALGPAALVSPAAASPAAVLGTTTTVDAGATPGATASGTPTTTTRPGTLGEPARAGVHTAGTAAVDGRRPIVPHAPRWLPAVAELNRNVGALPLLPGNDAHLVTGFDEQLDALVRAVRGARRYVHVEFYILSLDPATAPFFAALEDAVGRGVDVKVLLDHLGSRRYPGYRATVAELDRIGVEWHLMLPVQPLRGRYQRPDLRNHRKLVVVDGETAYVGSLNIIDPGYNKRANRRRGLRWQDLLVRLEGPVAQEIDALFVTDWYSETDELLATSREPAPDGDASGGTEGDSGGDPGGASSALGAGDLWCQVVPSGPGFDVENNLMMFNSLIYSAERRLSITSPYFVPDESLLMAITTAARRGVAVELFVGEVGDQMVVFHAQHSYYRALLEAGVRIWLYPGPWILHAKHLSVDELVTVVGSSNMDIRSFDLDLEVSLMSCGREFADEMRRVEDGYRALSRELTLAEWSRQSFWHGVVDGLARLTSAVQ